MTRIILAVLLCLSATVVPADPVPYVLEPDESRVEFIYRLLGNDGTGTMPVLQADMQLDIDRLANSSITVTLNAAAAQTGAAFVTDALKGPEILDTAAHPTVRFVSRSVAKADTGAQIVGDVTVRGVTRPLTLHAEIYRRSGSAPGDLSRMTVLLTGRISRSAFGASGSPDLVADTVRLRIIARLRRAD